MDDVIQYDTIVINKFTVKRKTKLCNVNYHQCIIDYDMDTDSVYRIIN